MMDGISSEGAYPIEQGGKATTVGKCKISDAFCIFNENITFSARNPEMIHKYKETTQSSQSSLSN